MSTRSLGLRTILCSHCSFLSSACSSLCESVRPRFERRLFPHMKAGLRPSADDVVFFCGLFITCGGVLLYRVGA
jgi:hypothetical protein